MDKIRSFIAVRLPPETREKLAEIEGILRRNTTAPVKWVDPGSIHLTLKFLGDIDAGTVDTLASALREAAGGISPFSLEVKDLGVFPNSERTQVVWAGLAGETGVLDRLQKNVESELEKLGFAREKRRFSPHLTLARVRDRASAHERKLLGDLIKETAFAAGTFGITSVELMKSVLTRQGAVYSVVASIRLG